MDICRSWAIQNIQSCLPCSHLKQYSFRPHTSLENISKQNISYTDGLHYTFSMNLFYHYNKRDFGIFLDYCKNAMNVTLSLFWLLFKCNKRVAVSSHLSSSNDWHDLFRNFGLYLNKTHGTLYLYKAHGTLLYI